jgi:hypothetical protein
MNISQRVAPVLAALAAVSTLLCCLPLSFAGAVGLAGVSAVAVDHRFWLATGSIALLAVGFVQVYRHPGRCAPRNRLSVITVWLSLFLIALVFLMPQLVATLLADWLG